MPKNEDGEFELILGNRQLLSVFFIVVILLGVFFTMGYIVGRNSSTATAELTPVPNVDPRPSAEAPARTREPVPAPSAPAQTAPQQPAAPVAESDPEPAKSEPKTEARASTGRRPAAGQTYLQLAATSRHEADIMVDVLLKKSFRAMAAEIDEKPGTFRVLVGPITDSTTNKMRADLQGAGFPGNAAIRRTF
ncbi:MAG: SPOR domain-containing protein [Acidobacteriota bacterium]